jgi:DNA ligase-1
MTDFAPMLAEDMTDVKKCSWPKLASLKLDGYRTLSVNGVAMSRNLKPVVNEYIQTILGKKKLHGLDGEITVGPPNDGNVIGRTASGLKRVNGFPDFIFWVFDDFTAHGHDFNYRTGRAEDRVDDAKNPRIRYLSHDLIHSAAGLRDYEAQALANGYEGVMLRCPNGPYKFGRSTEREGFLLKVKRFIDGEARVTGIEQGNVNNNPLEKDALGHAKRSTHKANMVPSGMLGTILGTDIHTGQPLRIAPGRMSHDDRAHYLAHPEELVGQAVKYKAFDYGTKDVDRFMTFQRILSADDLNPTSSSKRVTAAAV